MKKIRRISAIIIGFMAISLLLINIVGLFKNIRKEGLLEDADLRFKNDISLSYEQAMAATKRRANESEKAYARRVTTVVSQGLAHIDWNQISDTERYNQLVPIWENYFIYFMGKFSTIPEYKKYHFANYERSLQRGIGICGDASMVMSQLLDKQQVKNQLYTFPGHVILSASFSDGQSQLFDPDFGVILPGDLNKIRAQPELIEQAYLKAGYTQDDALGMKKRYQQDYEAWNGVSHFITKKYYFEAMAYFLKWPLPIFLLLLALFLDGRLLASHFSKQKKR